MLSQLGKAGQRSMDSVPSVRWVYSQFPLFILAHTDMGSVGSKGIILSLRFFRDTKVSHSNELKVSGKSHPTEALLKYQGPSTGNSCSPGTAKAHWAGIKKGDQQVALKHCCSVTLPAGLKSRHRLERAGGALEEISPLKTIQTRAQDNAYF